MGLPAISAVAGSLLTKLEGLHSAKAKTSSTPTTQASSTRDASNVSDPGLLFTQLQNLSQQNPAEFKKITSQVAQQLQAAGTTSTASAQTNMLTQIAGNFQHASQTGKFSDLFSHPSQTPGEPAASAPHQQYAASTGASQSSTIHSIFSQALSQIQTDLGVSATLNSPAI